MRSHCLPPPCQCSSAACKSACALVRWSPVTTLEVLVCLHVSCVCGIGWVHVRCLRGARASALSEYLTSARRMARYKEIGAVSNVANPKGCRLPEILLLCMNTWHSSSAFRGWLALLHSTRYASLCCDHQRGPVREAAIHEASFSCRGQISRFSHFLPLPPAPLAEDISMHMRRV